MLDLSPSGARVRLLDKGDLRSGETVGLSDCSCGPELGLEGQGGTLRWANGREIGIEFTRNLSHSPHKLQELLMGN